MSDNQIETELLSKSVVKVMRRVWDRALKQTSRRVWEQVWLIRDNSSICYLVHDQAEEDYDDR